MIWCRCWWCLKRTWVLATIGMAMRTNDEHILAMVVSFHSCPVGAHGAAIVVAATTFQKTIDVIFHVAGFKHVGSRKWEQVWGIDWANEFRCDEDYQLLFSGCGAVTLE